MEASLKKKTREKLGEKPDWNSLRLLKTAKSQLYNSPELI